MRAKEDSGEDRDWDFISAMADRMDLISVGLRRCSSFSFLPVNVRMKMLPLFSMVHILGLLFPLGIGIRL